MNKKGDAVAAIIIVVIIVVFIGWLISVGQRECNSNNDCGEGYYCGVKHNCHKIPVLEKEVIIQHRYVWPSIIIGLAIVAAAIILKYKKNRKKDEPKEDKPSEEISIEPHYTNF